MSAGRRAAAALVLLLAMAQPLGAVPERPKPEFVPADALLPHLRWPDGSVSLNDRCPVSKTRLARDIVPLFVNGRPVGFC